MQINISIVLAPLILILHPPLEVDDIHDFCSAIFKYVPEPLFLRLTSPLKRVCSKHTGRKL
jgi:hypothetical protein